MSVDVETRANLTQTVPFFAVTDMAASLAFYVDGVGFTMTHSWKPHGQVRWCALKRGGGVLMLQEYAPDLRPDADLGSGVDICFICEDALELYREFRARGLDPTPPFVGNGLWVTSLADPDGYKITFESPTDVAEETDYDPAVHG